MQKDILKEMAHLKDRINEMGERLSNWTDSKHEASVEDIAQAAQTVTDLEIEQIETAQTIMEHEIAIMELQEKINS